ncbi:MAG TPA: Hsp20/alpha crystallin family protein [Burkholderiales bacterium]|nr:Hsp20/alpha crystallin family protein [Burkholderiales bacterium]
MSNLTRVDPFSTGFDDWFKGLMLRPMRLDIDMPESMQIKMDVTRSEDGYVVKAEMPGMKKDDIHVSVDGSQVTVTGEVKRESEEKEGEQVIRSERYYGKVARSFTLPQDIDEARVEARYADGVLELELPRKAKAAGRKIAVK